MWSSLTHLLLPLGIKGSLLYWKQVLNIKFFFLISKSFPAQNFKVEFVTFPPNLVLFQCSYWCWLQSQPCIYISLKLGKLYAFPFQPLFNYYLDIHPISQSLLPFFPLLPHHSLCLLYLSPNSFSLAWIITVASQPLLKPSSSLPSSHLSLLLWHEWFFSKLSPGVFFFR